MKKVDRKIDNGFYWGTWKIDITKANINKKYVKLLMALYYNPFITKDQAYINAYGRYLNDSGNRFSHCVWASLRKNNLIEEFVNEEKKHVYSLTKLGRMCVGYAIDHLVA